MPFPPKMLERWLADPQALATIALARAHNRMGDGNRPMGLRPPSGFGSKTISTRSSSLGQLPLSSMAMKMAANRLSMTCGSRE